MKRFFLALSLLLLIVPSLKAEDVKVEHFSLQVEGHVISASISITPLLPHPIIERMRGGLPVVFTYWFTLRGVSKHWRDKKIGRERVSISVKYDPVRVEYTVKIMHGGELVDTQIHHHWQEAVNALTALKNWEIFDVPDDALGRMLYVEAWVDLLPRTRWLIFPDDIKTDVVTSSHFTIYE